MLGKYVLTPLFDSLFDPMVFSWSQVAHTPKHERKYSEFFCDLPTPQNPSQSLKISQAQSSHFYATEDKI